MKITSELKIKVRTQILSMAKLVFCVGLLCRKSSDRYFTLARGVI